MFWRKTRITKGKWVEVKIREVVIIKAKNDFSATTTKLTIKPTPPLDFNLSAGIFSNSDKQIQKYQDRKYWQVIRVHKKLMLVILAASGTVNAPVLKVELKSNQRIFDEDEKTVERIISSLFNLNLDLDQFYADVKRDRIMGTITQRLRGLRSPTTTTPFEALVSSIIEQQISLKVAHALRKKVVKTFGDVLRIGDGVYYAFPTPKELASATIEQLRLCGLSLRKAEYIKDASRLIVEGKLDLEALKNREDSQEIIKELCTVRGIGVWTAEMTMIRGMQKLDVIPADDLGLRRTISHYYYDDRKMPSNEARKVAKNWGKWAGLAGFYLIVAEMIGTVIP